MHKTTESGFSFDKLNSYVTAGNFSIKTGLVEKSTYQAKTMIILTLHMHGQQP